MSSLPLPDLLTEFVSFRQSFFYISLALHQITFLKYHRWANVNPWLSSDSYFYSWLLPCISLQSRCLQFSSPRYLKLALWKSHLIPLIPYTTSMIYIRTNILIYVAIMTAFRPLEIFQALVDPDYLEGISKLILYSIYGSKLFSTWCPYLRIYVSTDTWRRPEGTTGESLWY